MDVDCGETKILMLLCMDVVKALSFAPRYDL